MSGGSRPLWRATLAVLALPVLSLAADPPPPSEESSATAPATLVAWRWGKTPRGATRVVFETDRKIDYLTVEFAEGNGFEVHLIDTGISLLPEPLKIGDGRLARVALRRGPRGLVARLEGSSGRLSAHTFWLPNPPRVVVDVRPRPEQLTPPPAPSAPAPREQAANMPPSPVGPTPSPAARSVSPPPAPPQRPSPTRGASAEGGRAAGTFSSGEEEFRDLVEWIRGIELAAEALRQSRTEEERARHRRWLALLLAERGMLKEAERELDRALASGAGAGGNSFSDSLQLAEIRLELGDHEGAAQVARALEPPRASAREKLRLARVLHRCRFSPLAQALLEQAIPDLRGERRARAQLLLARCHWDQQAPKRAYSLLRTLAGAPDTPSDVLGSALLLQADCLWVLGEPRKAGGLYEAAQHQELSAEESAWALLQLGNLARRQGNVKEAIQRYRRAVERWPETFYATQASWFLRLTEQAEKLPRTEVSKDRG